MLLTPNKKFVHPHEVYELEYPAHWDQLQEDNARSCGFGPHDRDDVGLWLSIMPMSLDTSKLVDELPKLMQQTLAKSQGENMRQAVWCVIEEVASGGWGIGGTTLTADDFKALARG